MRLPFWLVASGLALAAAALIGSAFAYQYKTDGDFGFGEQWTIGDLFEPLGNVALVLGILEVFRRREDRTRAVRDAAVALLDQAVADVDEALDHFLRGRTAELQDSDRRIIVGLFRRCSISFSEARSLIGSQGDVKLSRDDREDLATLAEGVASSIRTLKDSTTGLPYPVRILPVSDEVLIRNKHAKFKTNAIRFRTRLIRIIV